MRNPQRHRDTGPTRAGSTLVEVLIAAMILSIVVMGTSAQMYYARFIQTRQLAKRTAIEAATARLEELRTEGFDRLAAVIPQDYATHYLTQAGGAWSAHDVDPGEQCAGNGQTLALVTTARFADIDGGAPSFDYLELSVRVPVNASGSDSVSLQTWLAF